LQARQDDADANGHTNGDRHAVRHLDADGGVHCDAYEYPVRR